MSTRSPSDPTLQLLLESLSDHAIYMLDPEGVITTWNRGAAELTGYSRDEIEGESFARFFPLEERSKGVPQRLLEEALAAGPAQSEGWRLRKDGSRFWALSSLHSVRTPEGDLVGFANITHDMSAQREAQQALVDSERRFRLLVDGVIDYALYMLDVNGTVTNWNRGAERIKGYRDFEIIGRHFSVFYTPGDRNAGLPARALATALEEGRFESEGWRVRKDGSRFWASAIVDPIYDEEGRHVGFAKITRDISQKKAAEEALADSERQFRLLVSGLVDYSLFMLDPNGIVSSWNTGAERIKGYRADEIIGQHFSRFYTDAERAAGVPMRALQTAASTGRYEAEGWRARKDGSLFWASVVIDAIHDETGEVIGFAKITRDITERRDAALELQRAHEQLAQAQKMEALGQLTGGVAHDFNNLLMVVSGQAQLLKTRIGKDPRSARALEAIETASRRGEDLTRHLLSFARRQRLQPVSTSLADRIHGLRELFNATLSKDVQLRIVLPSRLWPVAVDPGELELSLLNLAVNARDAMPAGGTLTIRGENVELAGGEVDPDLKGDFVALTVSDTGVGVPPDVLPRVFEPFFTTKEVNKGTGLGLSQVYGFARQSGGRAVILSELGQGTSLTLYLPRATDEPSAAPSEAPVYGPKGARILLVEDNPEVAEVATGMLEQLGHSVRPVVSAAGALAEIARGGAPDLVFSDVVMAGDMDGIDLARRLRTEQPGLPVLLATGYSRAADRLGGEFPILRKPYKLPELNRAILALLSRPTEPDDGKLVPIESARRARTKRGG
jgi:PAS domain S-box-containing protein